MMDNAPITIDGIPIDPLTLEETVALIVRWAREGSGGYIYTPNVDDIVKARRIPEFRRALLRARLRVPDGMGIVYGSRILGTPLPATVTGRLLPLSIVRASGAEQLPLAIIGGGPKAAERAGATLRANGARVVATISPPTPLIVDSPPDHEAVAKLVASGARIVFVCLGAPKQALWMARHSRDMPHAVLVGVGAAVDVLAGLVPEAPRWMTSVGLEWAFRLIRQPRRLARRYLLDDPCFFYWMLRARARGRESG